MGWLCARAAAGDRAGRVWFWRVLCPSLLGALTPDLLDKSYYILKISPYGRTIGHSVAVWGLIGLALWWSRRGRARSVVYVWWWCGACAHLLTDACNDLVMGVLHTSYVWSGWWGWPLSTPDHFEVRAAQTLLGPCRDCTSLLEWAVIAAALISAAVWAMKGPFARRAS